MPPILTTVADLRNARAAWRRAGETIGLVPTMGALHAGHLALVSAAKSDCRRVVVSIFVNPTQFAPNTDFEAYPRDLAGDVAKLAPLGVDAVFAPGVSEMYPDGFATTVTVSGIPDGLCGPHRPGHFAGVATVVAKLFNQVGPSRAYFGEKDWQQLQVVRRMARDLDLPLEIVGIATVREPDGLAMSSRNAYLGAAERERARQLYRAMSDAAAALGKGAPADAEIAKATATLNQAGFGPIDYIAVVEAESLKPVARVVVPCRIAAAAWLGKTRLIDNLPVLPR